MDICARIANQQQITRLGCPMLRSPGDQIADGHRMDDAIVGEDWTAFKGPIPAMLQPTQPYRRVPA